MSGHALTDVGSRHPPPTEAGTNGEGDEVRRRKQAERERDAAILRATEAARRAALARRDATEQRARAEAAEDALIRSTLRWMVIRPIAAAGNRLLGRARGALRAGARLARRAAGLGIRGRQQERTK